MAKTRKTSRMVSPRSGVSRELADPVKVGEQQQRLARRRAYAQRTGIAYAAGGDDRSEVERMVAAAVDALPDPEFTARSAEARERYEALTPEERERDRGRSFYAESPGDVAPVLRAAKQRADAAERAEYVFRTPEDPMYVPGGEEILGAPGSVDFQRYAAPKSDLEQKVSASGQRGTAEVPYAAIEAGAEAIVNKKLAEIGDNIQELDKLMDRAIRMREQLAAGRHEPTPYGDLTDVEVAYAIRFTGPDRKAVAGRFTAAARQQMESIPYTDETGAHRWRVPILDEEKDAQGIRNVKRSTEAIATRYAMQPALSGALKSAYKSSRRAKMDPTARNLAAAAQAWHLLMQLRGASKRFNAMLRQYLSASRSKRETYGFGALRLDIFLLAKEQGLTVPPELGKWPSAELLHKRWREINPRA